MSAPAIFLMIVTILLVWGGLVASLVALKTLPVPDDDADDPQVVGKASTSTRETGE